MEKRVEELHTWLKSGKNIGHFACRRKYVFLCRLHQIALKALSSSEMVLGYVTRTLLNLLNIKTGCT